MALRPTKLCGACRFGEAKLVVGCIKWARTVSVTCMTVTNPSGCEVEASGNVLREISANGLGEELERLLLLVEEFRGRLVHLLPVPNRSGASRQLAQSSLDEGRRRRRIRTY